VGKAGTKKGRRMATFFFDKGAEEFGYKIR
jgi:hypothetical protein